MKSLLLATLIFSSISNVSLAQSSFQMGLEVAASLSVPGFLSYTLAEDATISREERLQRAKSMMSAGVILGLLISATPNSKEQMDILKNDAALYVAGFEKSETLIEMIEQARAAAPELNQYSDEEIALALTVIK